MKEGRKKCRQNRTHIKKLHCLLEKGSKNFEQINICASFLCLVILFHCDLDLHLSDNVLLTFSLLKILTVLMIEELIIFFFFIYIGYF